MSHEVMKYEVDCWVELYSDDPQDKFIKVDEEQYNLINKIWLTTNAKCIKIGDRTIATSAIKEVRKKTTDRPQPAENTISEEQREKNLKSLEELREQLKVKEII